MRDWAGKQAQYSTRRPKAGEALMYDVQCRKIGGHVRHNARYWDTIGRRSVFVVAQGELGHGPGGARGKLGQGSAGAGPSLHD